MCFFVGAFFARPTFEFFSFSRCWSPESLVSFKYVLSAPAASWFRTSTCLHFPILFLLNESTISPSTKKKAKRRFLCVSAVAASLTTGSLFTTKEHGMRAFVLAEISQESCGAELHNYLPQLFGGTKDTHCKLGLAYPYRSNRPTLGGLCCFNFLGTEGPIAAI